MTAEEFQTILNNQKILDKKLDGIISELRVMKNDISTGLNNQVLLEEYQRDIIKRLERIEKK
tara:strand:- start:294 stop:479 length:186 start_codon:yes stop_codon:yes gene_type:complete